MKFFYISNDACTDCGRCTKMCPTSAIYVVEGKRYINYDKCTACGTCMKECAAQAITLETLENITREIERVDQYIDQIRSLENELGKLRHSLKDSQKKFSEIVCHIPVPVFVADRSNRIIVANSAFIEILKIDSLTLDEAEPNLEGSNLETLFPEEIMRFVRLAIMDDQVQSFVAEINGLPMSISIDVLSDQTTLGVVRDLSDRSVVAEEIITRLKETIDRKLSMVQKIGFLLGEEVSVVVNNLNTVIDIVDSSSDVGTGNK